MCPGCALCSGYSILPFQRHYTDSNLEGPGSIKDTLPSSFSFFFFYPQAVSEVSETAGDEDATQNSSKDPDTMTTVATS